MKREANRDELAIFERFRKAVIDGRPEMRGYIGACETMATIEEWRRNQIGAGLASPELLPIVFSAAQVAECEQRVAAWNRLEAALFGLEAGRLGFRVENNIEGRRDIVVLQQSETGLGVAPLIWLAGIVIITGGILAAMNMRHNNLEDARKLKRDLSFLNARMARSAPPVRDSFKALQASTNYTEPKSAWDKLTGGLASVGGGLMVAVLVIGGIMLLNRRGAVSGSPLPNPCGAGTPDDWDVVWSEDPEAAERQLEHVLQSLDDKGLERRWGKWFKGYGKAYGGLPF